MDMVFVRGARVAGPLAPYARGFAGELDRLGYRESTARGHLGLAAHVSRWLGAAGLGAADLTACTVEVYFAARRSAGYAAFLTPRALVPLLEYLRGLGVAPRAQAVAPGSTAEKLLERYCSWLVSERGFRPYVARSYVHLVRPFVAGRVRGEGADLAYLTAGEVMAFMVASSRRLAPPSVQRLAAALRSLLRFWHLEGLIGGPLDKAVPSAACRPQRLPRALEPAQVQALLASCDLAGPQGLRDLAMITLLARMGLRAGEVAGLQLDDIDWRHGELTVRGKGNRRDLLPLPADAGQALAAYLRHGRPAAALGRSVFIRVSAPYQGLTRGGVTMAVSAAGRRAGLGVIYAHRLRHSAATSMLAAGAPLAEIGQVLRHRLPLTTAVYAKVDIAALRALARPWPGVS
jgi:integrase/recombinase XerD